MDTMHLTAHERRYTSAKILPCTLSHTSPVDTTAPSSEDSTPSRSCSSLPTVLGTPRYPGLHATVGLPQTPGWGTPDNKLAALEGAAACSPCVPTAQWSDAIDCAVCGCELGKRHLKPRHHCRICKASVCASCSPSRVEFGGQVDRICTPCVASVCQPAFALPMPDPAQIMADGICNRRWCSQAVWEPRLPDRALELQLGWSQAANCHVCGDMLGKRRFNPRHHCRLCKQSVCATCSPSRVQIPGLASTRGLKSLERICTHCVPSLYKRNQCSDQQGRGPEQPQENSTGSIGNALQALPGFSFGFSFGPRSLNDNDTSPQQSDRQAQWRQQVAQMDATYHKMVDSGELPQRTIMDRPPLTVICSAARFSLTGRLPEHASMPHNRRGKDAFDSKELIAKLEALKLRKEAQADMWPQENAIRMWDLWELGL